MGIFDMFRRRKLTPEEIALRKLVREIPDVDPDELDIDIPKDLVPCADAPERVIDVPVVDMVPRVFVSRVLTMKTGRVSGSRRDVRENMLEHPQTQAQRRARGKLVKRQTRKERRKNRGK